MVRVPRAGNTEKTEPRSTSLPARELRNLSAARETAAFTTLVRANKRGRRPWKSSGPAPGRAGSTARPPRRRPERRVHRSASLPAAALPTVSGSAAMMSPAKMPSSSAEGNTFDTRAPLSATLRRGLSPSGACGGAHPPAPPRSPQRARRSRLPGHRPFGCTSSSGLRHLWL